jgi:stearoyl-CoA desaturase (delta-9 desaturase)
MSPFWEKVFYLFAYITQGSSYMSPRIYGIMHRMHHAYTDTEKDPHSPSYSPNVFAMMWRTRYVYLQIAKGKADVEQRFVKGLPDWRGFDNWAGSSVSRLLWVGIYTGFYITFASSAWLFLLLPVTITMGPVHGAIINWFAHKYGYTNYKLKNTAENLFCPDVLMLGESYHNNHHKHPSSINFGVRWCEFDPVYPVILLMKWLRIISIPAPVPAYKKDKTIRS